MSNDTALNQGVTPMRKTLLLFLFLLVQTASSVQILASKLSATTWGLTFSHIPASENIGAFRLCIALDNKFDISTITSDAAQKGAWSQVKPELSPKGHQIEVLGVGPAMLKSKLTDTTEIFQITFGSTTGVDAAIFGGIIDSVWFKECLNPLGESITPQLYKETVSIKRNTLQSDRSGKIDHHRIGRVHSFTILLTKKEQVKATVVDVRGRTVARITNKIFAPGLHTLRWSPEGTVVASGTYYLQIELDKYTYSKKVSHVQ